MLTETVVKKAEWRDKIEKRSNKWKGEWKEEMERKRERDCGSTR